MANEAKVFEGSRERRTQQSAIAAPRPQCRQPSLSISVLNPAGITFCRPIIVHMERRQHRIRSVRTVPRPRDVDLANPTRAIATRALHVCLWS
jgi:hypothetical protein